MNYFDKYISNYDMSDPDINYKYYHSFRVMNNMELLSKCLNLPTKDVELAKNIGLFHDIGRFEQDKIYNSFIDDKMDHGEYGVEVLKKENILSNYNTEIEDYEVVYKAIRNHNKFKIEDNLNQRELLFSKLIRDADKLDILYALSNEEIKPHLYEDDSQISESVKKCFYDNKQILKNQRHSINDSIIIALGFVFDINYGVTLNIINNYKYIDKIYQRLNQKDLFKPYFDYINNYIEERID